MVLNTYRMPDKEIPRSIRFPESLWNAIDNDAKRCKRSSVKQLEALLVSYYGLENVNFDENRLGEIQNQNNVRQKSGSVLTGKKIPSKKKKVV